MGHNIGEYLTACRIVQVRGNGLGVSTICVVPFPQLSSGSVDSLAIFKESILGSAHRCPVPRRKLMEGKLIRLSLKQEFAAWMSVKGSNPICEASYNSALFASMSDTGRHMKQSFFEKPILNSPSA